MPISEFKIYQASLKQWTPLKRSADGFWLLNTNYKWIKPLNGPYKVRLTSINEQEIEDTIPQLGE